MYKHLYMYTCLHTHTHTNTYTPTPVLRRGALRQQILEKTSSRECCIPLHQQKKQTQQCSDVKKELQKRRIKRDPKQRDM